MGKQYLYKIGTETQFYIGQSLATEFLGRVSSHIFNSYGIMYWVGQRYNKETKPLEYEVHTNQKAGSQNDVQNVYRDIAYKTASDPTIIIQTVIVKNIDKNVDGFKNFSKYWTFKASYAPHLEYSEVMAIEFNKEKDVNKEAGAQRSINFEWKKFINTDLYKNNFKQKFNNFLTKINKIPGVYIDTNQTNIDNMLLDNILPWERNWDRLTRPIHYILNKTLQKELKSTYLELTLSAEEVLKMFNSTGKMKINDSKIATIDLELNTEKAQRIIHKKLLNATKQVNNDNFSLSIPEQEHIRTQVTQLVQGYKYNRHSRTHYFEQITYKYPFSDLTVNTDCWDNAIKAEWYPDAKKTYSSSASMFQDTKQDVKNVYIQHLIAIYKEYILGSFAPTKKFKALFTNTNASITKDENWYRFYDPFMAALQQNRKGNLVFQPILGEDGLTRYMFKREKDNAFYKNSISEDSMKELKVWSESDITIW